MPEPTKEVLMAKKVNWETRMDDAVSKATSQDKPILLDFFNPG